MSHQRAIKKALMRGKGYATTDVEELKMPSGKVYARRRVSTLGWYSLVSCSTRRPRK